MQLQTLALGCISTNFLLACSSGGSSTLGDVPTLSTDGSNNVTLAFTTYPTLQTQNGTLTVNIQSGHPTVVYAYNILRYSSSAGYAIRNLCTYDNTQVNSWSGSNFLCAKCGSSYSFDGSVLTGPTSQSLTAYQANSLSGGLTFFIP